MTMTTEKQNTIWTPNYDEYVVLDMETTTRAPAPYKFKATPCYPDNYVVAAGVKIGSAGVQTKYTHIPGLTYIKPGYPENKVLVGHNIKFDLAYLLRDNHTLPACPVWDTGIAHYMMTGQRDKMPSLNDLGGFYQLGTKETGVTDLFEMGVPTEDIDRQLLLDYLERDLLLTEAVYKAQLKRTEDMPWLREHIIRISTASMFFAAAELNGLPIDQSKLAVRSLETAMAVSRAEVDLASLIRTKYGLADEQLATVQVTTPTTIGRLLFELPLKVTDWEPAGRVLASGKIAKRRRKIDVEYAVVEAQRNSRLIGMPVPKTMGGAVMTSDDVLDVMAPIQPEIVKVVKEFRAATKLQGYIDPALKTINESGAPTLFPSFHQTTTNTGRSSSSGPNAQQMPSELEDCVLPVYGQYLIKADFKQLQICGVAELSGDPQLIDDLNSGRDVHYETGKLVFGWCSPAEMTKEDRRVVKNTNFGLIFGGRAAGLAKQTGVDKKIVQQCIDAFYSRYPRVKQWVDDNVERIERAAVPSESLILNGEQVREAFLKTPAGRILRFTEKEVPAWMAKKTGRSIGFSPMEIANYPVQGYTDGDLAMTLLAILATTPTTGTVYRPVNFVHDSIWVLTSQVEETKLHILKAVEELNTRMGLKVPLVMEFTVVDSAGMKVGEKEEKDGNEVRSNQVPDQQGS